MVNFILLDDLYLTFLAFTFCYPEQIVLTTFGYFAGYCSVEVPSLRVQQQHPSRKSNAQPAELPALTIIPHRCSKRFEKTKGTLATNFSSGVRKRASENAK